MARWRKYIIINAHGQGTLLTCAFFFISWFLTPLHCTLLFQLLLIHIQISTPLLSSYHYVNIIWMYTLLNHAYLYSTTIWSIYCKTLHFPKPSELHVEGHLAHVSLARSKTDNRVYHFENVRFLNKDWKRNDHKILD